jgi:uncharacterized protein
MSVELRPFGVQCNIQCQYCYQNPQRDAGNLPHSYDMQKMKDAIKAEGGPFSLFGGEPLLMPLKDLEELWSWGCQQFGHNAVQTNATLITEDHFRLFRKYKVQVGVSLDGPGELNDARWHGSIDKTRESTARAETAIERLCIERMPPSLIVTLHRGNATAARLPILYDWMRYLQGIGICWVRLHLLESESAAVREKYALTTEENLQALKGFLALEKELRRIKFDMFSDMRKMLTGNDQKTTCVWNACDPYTTRAVRGVEGHGQRTNCGRTNKDGIDFVKANTPGFERYLALYHTPQEAGGCRGCRFFLMCKGQCPGTAIDGDWRNRTEHCEVWKAMYAILEKELEAQGKIPLSRNPIRHTIEKGALAAWSRGQNPTIARLLGKPADPRRKPQPAAASRADAIKEFQKQLQLLAAHEFCFHLA